MGIEMPIPTDAADAAALTASSGSTALLLRRAEALVDALKRATLTDGEAPARILSAVVAALAREATDEKLNAEVKIDVDNARAPSPLERALFDTTRHAVDRCAATDGNETRSVALLATRSFVDAAARAAPRAAADAAAAWCFERGCARIALVAGSALAARAAVAAAVSASSVAVVDTALDDSAGKALALALADVNTLVRYGPLAAAHDLLDGVDALLLGAHEVAMNGAVVVSEGAAAVASLARQADIPVVVVAQSAKFSDAVLVGIEADGRDVLRSNEVDVIVTEDGNVDPHMAPSLVERRE